MIITRRHLSRREVLRGAGAAIALPFLDAMCPALSADHVSAATPVVRLLVVEFSMGVVDSQWDPVGEGYEFTMSPSLQPLEHHRKALTIIRGFTSSPDRSKADFHGRNVASFLTGCEPASDRIHVGVSMDQIAARTLGRTTQFASLELGTQMEVIPQAGLSYKDADTLLPIERNPRVLFERLFGDTDKIDPIARAARLAEDGSLLDSVVDRVAQLKRELGNTDRAKLDQYLDSVRDIERRVKVVSEGPTIGLPGVARPAGIPDNWQDHVKLMFDLQVLALQADLTRVITFTMETEASVMTFPHLGIPMTFHEVSHHNELPHKLDALAKINRNHSELFAYFLDKLDSIKEADGSLLDNSAILYGSSFSNPSIHSQRNLPIIIAGGGAGRLRGGNFQRVTGHNDGPPLANLHLALLDKVGVPTPSLGDSTEIFGGLAG